MCRFVIFLLSSIAKAVRLVAIIFLTVRGSRHGGIDGYRRCTGIIFSTRAIVGCVVVCGVECICGSCARVLFLVPVQLWGTRLCAVWTGR